MGNQPVNERLFARLADWVAREPVVLASVLATRGATPRKAGARMLITSNATDGSIGGGLAEARVIAAARELLERSGPTGEVHIDLTGGVGSAGVCGGHMQLALRRWAGDVDRQRAGGIARKLASGKPVELDDNDVGARGSAVTVAPDPRLLIVGGGHCGLALYELASTLDFDIWVYDPRPDQVDQVQYPRAHTLTGDFIALRKALVTQRALYVVLLNRDYVSDVAALRVLAGATFAFLGMMGSRKRISEVLSALDAEQAKQLAALQAPVGLPIGAQTPQEIAVSVLAHLIQVRSSLSL
jgi:xanthine dehydrogenase accessory factor